MAKRRRNIDKKLEWIEGGLREVSPKEALRLYAENSRRVGVSITRYGKPEIANITDIEPDDLFHVSIAISTPDKAWIIFGISDDEQVAEASAGDLYVTRFKEEPWEVLPPMPFYGYEIAEIFRRRFAPEVTE